MFLTQSYWKALFSTELFYTDNLLNEFEKKYELPLGFPAGEAGTALAVTDGGWLCDRESRHPQGWLWRTYSDMKNSFMRKKSEPPSFELIAIRFELRSRLISIF